jgi:hypothetical protein
MNTEDAYKDVIFAEILRGLARRSSRRGRLSTSVRTPAASCVSPAPKDGM